MTMIRPQRLINDYVQYYDNVLNEDQCKEIVRVYNENPSVRTYANNNGYPSMHWMDISANVSSFGEFKDPDIAAFLNDKMYNTYLRYCRDLNLQYQVPPKFAFENLRINHFAQGGDRFDDHVDVLDQQTASRYMQFVLFLTECDGGEMFFPDCNLRIEPKPGRLVICPSTWTFPYAQLEVSKGDKVLVSTFLHYIPTDPQAVSDGTDVETIDGEPVQE